MDIIGRFAADCLCFKPTAVALGPEIYKAILVMVPRERNSSNEQPPFLR